MATSNMMYDVEAQTKLQGSSAAFADSLVRAGFMRKVLGRGALKAFQMCSYPVCTTRPDNMHWRKHRVPSPCQSLHRCYPFLDIAGVYGLNGHPPGLLLQHQGQEPAPLKSGAPCTLYGLRGGRSFFWSPENMVLVWRNLLCLASGQAWDAMYQYGDILALASVDGCVCALQGALPFSSSLVLFNPAPARRTHWKGKQGLGFTDSCAARVKEWTGQPTILLVLLVCGKKGLSRSYEEIVGK
eukprot:scaffold173507_cov19-Tisochrysis_lutea.AAC.1